MAHPLCELCEEEGRVVAAVDVHHIHSPFVEGMEYALDAFNLLSLCKECHGRIHTDTAARTKLFEIYKERTKEK